MSVCLPGRNNSVATERIYKESDIWVFLEKEKTA